MSKVKPNARWVCLDEWLISKGILKRGLTGLVKVKKKTPLIIIPDED